MEDAYGCQAREGDFYSLCSHSYFGTDLVTLIGCGGSICSDTRNLKKKQRGEGLQLAGLKGKEE